MMTAVIAVVVVALLVVAGFVVWDRFQLPASPVEEGLSAMPEKTLIASFTDWSAARADLSPDIASGSTIRTKRSFYDNAYDKDYSVGSVLSTFDQVMTDKYGWSVLDTDWEMYGQARAGAVEVLKMSEDFDFDAAGDALSRLGYPAADGDGVRAAGPDVVAAVSPGLTPQLGYLALLPDERLVVTSDSGRYTTQTLEVIKGDRDSLYDVEGVPPLAVSFSSKTVVAVLELGSRACVGPGFGAASASERRLARQRIAEVGGIHPFTGLGLATDPGGVLTVAMQFAEEDQAAADLRPRQRLARGEAPDQGGTFEERFKLAVADVKDATLVLALKPSAPDAQLLSDLGRGGLLFASCGAATR